MSDTTRMKFVLPDDMEIRETETGHIFEGTAHELLELSELVRQLKFIALDTECSFGPLTFIVSDIPTDLAKADGDRNLFPRDVVQMPNAAWNVLATKIAEVATAWETSPFSFNQYGHLQYKLPWDIGAHLIGLPLR